MTELLSAYYATRVLGYCSVYFLAGTEVNHGSDRERVCGVHWPATVSSVTTKTNREYFHGK